MHHVNLRKPCLLLSHQEARKTSIIIVRGQTVAVSSRQQLATISGGKLSRPMRIDKYSTLQAAKFSSLLKHFRKIIIADSAITQNPESKIHNPEYEEVQIYKEILCKKRLKISGLKMILTKY